MQKFESRELVNRFRDGMSFLHLSVDKLCFRTLEQARIVNCKVTFNCSQFFKAKWKGWMKGPVI